MDKPDASLPWATSQVPLVGSRLHVVPELLWGLYWEPWRSASLLSLSPLVETETGSL